MTTDNGSRSLFVVGIAASAGGLPAMMDLLEHASCHKSMCFVVVSHVDRQRRNDLAPILSRASSLDAVTIESGMPLSSCKLYTIPAGQYVEIKDGGFRLTPRPKNVPNQSADVFFTSLAKNYGRNAIGVVLSGAQVGEDGSRGVVAIKNANGHTYAQEPSSAKFPQMPAAAISTGCIDSVMTPESIGHELALINWALT